MATPLENRLSQALKMSGAIVLEVEAGSGLRSAEEPREHEYSRFGAEMGFKDIPGKSQDDLAVTRFPAGVPEDLAPEIIKRFKLEDFVGPDDLFCLRVRGPGRGPDGRVIRKANKQPVDPGDKNKPLAQLKPLGEPGGIVAVEPAWEKDEIYHALAPMIIKASGRYSGGGFNRGEGSHDDTARTDLSQNGALAILYAIESGEDRGDAYLSWILPKIIGLMSGGMVRTGPQSAAAGFYGKLIKATRPDQVDIEIATIPEQDRVSNNPRKPKDGNKYGDLAPELYKAAMERRDLLVRYQAAKGAERAELSDEKDEQTEELKHAQEATKEHGKLLGAKSGLYDTFNLPKEDDKFSRYLWKLLNAHTPEDLEEVGPLKIRGDTAKQLNEFYFELLAARQNGDEEAIAEVEKKIRASLEKKGRTAAFNKVRGMQGMETKGSESGDDVENKALPSMPDNASADMRDRESTHINKEIVRKLLKAGYNPKYKPGEGVLVGKDKQNRPRYVKFEERDFRVLIRMFGIKDYPYKMTAYDPEFDEEKYQEYEKALLATVGQTDTEKAVWITPESPAEARRLIKLAAEIVSRAPREEGGEIDFDDESVPDEEDTRGKVNYDEFEASQSYLMDVYNSTKTVPVLAPDEDMALELAQRIASSKWVRNGCQQLTGGQIYKDIMSDIDRSNTGQVMGKVAGVPERKEIPERFRSKYLGSGQADPESKLALIGWAMKDELGIDPDDPQWGPVNKSKKEDYRRILNTVVEGACWKMYKIVDHFCRKAIMTEAIDDVDLGLLNDVRDAARNHLAEASSRLHK